MANPIMELQVTVTEFANSLPVTYAKQLAVTLKQVAAWLVNQGNERMRVIDISYTVNEDGSCHVYVYHCSE